jgi:hypothetical protein
MHMDADLRFCCNEQMVIQLAATGVMHVSQVVVIAAASVVVVGK